MMMNKLETVALPSLPPTGVRTNCGVEIRVIPPYGQTNVEITIPDSMIDFRQVGFAYPNLFNALCYTPTTCEKEALAGELAKIKLQYGATKDMYRELKVAYLFGKALLDE